MRRSKALIKSVKKRNPVVEGLMVKVISDAILLGNDLRPLRIAISNIINQYVDGDPENRTGEGGHLKERLARDVYLFLDENCSTYLRE